LVKSYESSGINLFLWQLISAFAAKEFAGFAGNPIGAVIRPMKKFLFALELPKMPPVSAERVGEFFFTEE